MSEPTIRRAGATVILFAVLAKGVGFVREAVIAATYGTTHVVDVYLAAITVPALIGTILYYSLPNAFVPLFAVRGVAQTPIRRQGWRVIALMALLTSGLWVFAGPLASLTNRGFDPALKSQSVFLFRIVSGTVFLGTVEALARSRLLARKRFIQSGISSLWLNVAVIVAVVLFAEGGASTLAWGYVAGSALVALWNLLPLQRGTENTTEVSPRAVDGKSNDDTGRWILIVLMINIAGLLYGLIDRYFASFLAEGSIAALQYAAAIASQPVAVCGAALATAVFPYLAERSGADDRIETVRIIDRSIRWILIGAVPAAVYMALLGDQIVSVLYERGQFNASSRLITASLLRVYAVWLVPAALGALLGKIFYADRRWRPVLLAVGIALVAKAGFSYWWVQRAGVQGLAAASVLSTGVSAATLLYLLMRWRKGQLWQAWLKSTVSLVVLSVVACLIGRGVPSVILTGSHARDSLVALACAVLVGAVLLVLFGPRLGLREIAGARAALITFLGRRK